MMRRGGIALASGLALVAVAGCQPGQPTVFDYLASYAQPSLPQAPEGTTYLEIGHRLLKARQPELALKSYLRSIRIEGMTSEAMNGAGVAAETLGRLGEARKYFEAAVKLDPNSILARNNYGVTLYRLGEYYKAKTAFEAAFALSDGTDQVAAQNLGLVDLKIQRLEAAAPRPEPNADLVRTGTDVYLLRPLNEAPLTCEGEG